MINIKIKFDGVPYYGIFFGTIFERITSRSLFDEIYFFFLSKIHVCLSSLGWEVQNTGN